MSRLAPRKKRTPAYIKIGLTVSVLAIVAFAAWIILRPKQEEKLVNNDDSSTINYDPPTEEDIQIGRSISDPTKTGSSGGSDTPTHSETLAGVIPFAGFAGDELLITTDIGQLVTGTCNITITSGGALVYENSVGIVASPKTSACDNFRISGLDSQASYSIKITVTADDGRSGEINKDI